MKHKRQDRPVKKNLAFPQSIVERVDEQLNDPLTNRPTFGSWSALVIALLAKWLNGEIQVAVPLRKVRPFCHICLLDKEFHASCNNVECPMKPKCPHQPAKFVYRCAACGILVNPIPEPKHGNITPPPTVP